VFVHLDNKNKFASNFGKEGGFILRLFKIAEYKTLWTKDSNIFASKIHDICVFDYLVLGPHLTILDTKYQRLVLAMTKNIK
jgi:hypothetical protein